ncbi:MgtC/SapB family protein [Bowmanella dokdonensis]|uniref:MgtC/SapB family protein n=1 Tax=Bowmanella dokdonensis TaxID=751969 RepID=A0A939DS36_9ALTE|nr:MgtC/SapB family protein [Bowmanella dokdonensis]
MDTQAFILLGIALAIGLLIGVERGWRFRQQEEGKRVAGLRTFGLTGLLGGCSGMLLQNLGGLGFALIFIGFCLSVAVAYWSRSDQGADASITSLISLLLTFVLGAMAALNLPEVAVAAAVVSALLLRYKELLHGWLQKLEERELQAALQLLLISLVMLPVLPDEGYGPWQVLNPYEIWLMVVLIAGISFIGYVAMKWGGADKGIILTALSAGMVSSTALTLHFSRLSRQQSELSSRLSVGILLACGTMFPRVLLVASLINPAIFNELWLPVTVMALILLLACALLWNRRGATKASITHLVNPLELRSAILFGGLLTLILLAGKALTEFFGEAGIYILAVVSGIADVDPVNLTLSRMSLADISVDKAALGILLASSTNTLVKALISVSVAGAGMLWRVLLPLLLAAVTGLAIAWI